MSLSTVETHVPTATNVRVGDDVLIVDPSAGRSVAVPPAWDPRLSQGTRDERNQCRADHFVGQ